MQYNHEFMYRNSRGTLADDADAARWFRMTIGRVLLTLHLLNTGTGTHLARAGAQPTVTEP